MPQQLALESFEQHSDDAAAPSAEFEAGYEEGYAAAIATAKGNQNALGDAFVQAISDVEFSHAEARAHILKSLTPLFTTVIEKLLPQLSYDSFGLLIVQAIYEAAQHDTAKLPVLQIHPNQRQAVETVAHEHGLEITITEDPTLASHAAWIGQARGETYLNVDSLLTETSATLSAIFEANKRMNSHE
ncbi:hypothetical protein [Yoonia sp. I 8.24]|uniref:hypothetical protein n=1 Tax=Yoonia sp. I 8.24 TaxID=1537229 RepID=UPI001EDF36CD|nr:hypothetical protein [Yoonia sp. I 8.24]MCG3269093.1 hypothetical protein [Yoonia sp. I 8.24]